MAKTSSVTYTPAKASGTLIGRNERNLLNSQLPPCLRKLATHFISEVKKQFDPLAQRRESFWSSMSADKFAHIAKQYSKQRNPRGLYTDSRIYNMFNSPVFFPEGTWQRLTNQDRQKVISVGLQAAENTILLRHKADGSRVFRTSLLAASCEPTSRVKHSRAPAARKSTLSRGKERLASATQPVSGHTSHRAKTPTTIVSHEDQSSSAAYDRSVPATKDHSFDPQILSTHIRNIPWPEDNLTNTLDARGSRAITLLDLVNLPARELFFTLRAAKLPHNKFNSWLEVVEDSTGLSLGKTLSLFFAPLGKDQGGLRLTNRAVKMLHDIPVAPSCLEKGRVTTSSLPCTLRIDNGWRLLRHYKHSEMKILSDQELQSIYTKFREAGF